MILSLYSVRIYVGSVCCVYVYVKSLVFDDCKGDVGCAVRVVIEEKLVT